MAIFSSLKRSLQIKLIIVVIIIPSSIHVLFSAIKIFDEKALVIQEVESTKDRVLNELAHGLADPLWNFDYEQAKTLVMLKLKERHFVGVTIIELETGFEIFSMVKKENQIFEVKKPDVEHSWVITANIDKEGVLLWQARCFFTSRYADEIIFQKICYSLIMNLALTITLTVLLIITLHILVISPIKKTTHVIRQISDGDFSNRIEIKQIDEIGEISNEVNSFLDQMESAISEVNLVMQAMADGDFSKRITVNFEGDLDKLKKRTNRSIEILADRTKELKEAQQELIDKAHQAGMAEVASGTLHNVGNILNSVKVSAQVIRNDVDRSDVVNFVRANELLKDNLESLEDFILKDPKGKKLLEYYLKLESVLVEEQEQIRRNLVRLNSKIDMIADVILAQQNNAGISSLTEPYSLETIIDDALILQSGSIDRYGIQVVKRLGSVPMIPVQKAKLVHILINLIKNAKESMMEKPKDKRTLTITSEYNGNSACLKIQDTGKGIDKSSLKKIFTHGYTTKHDGHGFGLHSCSSYMAEMKGKIWAESEGLDKGATFVLEFNLEENAPKLAGES